MELLLMHNAPERSIRDVRKIAVEHPGSTELTVRAGNRAVTLGDGVEDCPEIRAKLSEYGDMKDAA